MNSPEASAEIAGLLQHHLLPSLLCSGANQVPVLKGSPVDGNSVASKLSALVLVSESAMLRPSKP